MKHRTMPFSTKKARLPAAAAALLLALSLILAPAPALAAPPKGADWWQYPAKVDVMLISAHPDDDQLFMGAITPLAVEQGKTVLVVFMTYASNNRKQEALNGLMAVGNHTYPVFGPFPDKLTNSLDEARKFWKDKDTLPFLTEIVRKYKPSVIVTHDVNGEYGHGAHRLSADLAQTVFKNAGDPSFCPGSAQQYGVWSPAKLYLHLYKENKISLDVKAPLSAYNGKSAFEIAKAGYAAHESQHKYWFYVADSGKLSIKDFGMAASRVGTAEQGMFDNTDPVTMSLINPQPQASVFYPLKFKGGALKPYIFR